MTGILETIMLVCFGISWPLSVWNNLKSGTAKAMSLPFILMIALGYVAGITAKVMSKANLYVLIIYCINLFFVLCNLVLYFVNRRKDKQRLATAGREALKREGGLTA